MAGGYPSRPPNTSGWASYVDTQYQSSGSAYSLAANTTVTLPNNAGTVIQPQIPYQMDSFYDGTKILANQEDAIAFMAFFKCVPTNPAQFVDIWLDIGGSIGEIYRQTYAFAKGSGVEMGIVYSLPVVYEMDTFVANGGAIKIRSDNILSIYQINYNFARLHKAR